MDHHLNPLIEVGEVRLAYRVAGNPESPPMVLLHGIGFDGSSWDPVVPSLTEDWRGCTYPIFAGSGGATGRVAIRSS